MRNNATLTEPRSLTRTGLWSLHKSALRTWATGRCLLEHKGADELDAMTKDQLVDEILGVLLYIEVQEDRRALATDTLARSVEEIVR